MSAASCGTSPGTTIEPRRRGSGSSHSATIQAFTARDERDRGIGVLDRLGAIRAVEDRRLDIPRIEHPRAEIGDGGRDAVGPGEVGAQAARRARRIGRVRRARGTGSWPRPRASARRARGRAHRSTAHSRGRRRRSRRPPEGGSRGGFETESHAIRHRHVEDVPLGVVEAAVPVPVRLDDVRGPGHAVRHRARRSPPRGRRRRTRTTPGRPGPRRGRAASAARRRSRSGRSRHRPPGSPPSPASARMAARTAAR